MSYQNESFSSKWELPWLPPSSLELWRRERARRQLSFWWETLILIGHYGSKFKKSPIDFLRYVFLPCVWDFACTIFIHSKNNWALMGLCQNSCYLTFCLWPLLGLTWFRLTYTHTSCTCLKIKGMSNSKDVYDPGGGFLIFISLSLCCHFYTCQFVRHVVDKCDGCFFKEYFSGEGD